MAECRIYEFYGKSDDSYRPAWFRKNDVLEVRGEFGWLNIFRARIHQMFGGDLLPECFFALDVASFYKKLNEAPLSGGIKQLVFYCFLFSCRDKIIILDNMAIFHPAYAQMMHNWIMEAHSQGSRIYVSTHSSELLSTFTEDFREGKVELLMFSRNRIPEKRTPDTLEPLFQGGLDLGDLFRAGDPLLGGWPW